MAVTLTLAPCPMQAQRALSAAELEGKRVRADIHYEREGLDSEWQPAPAPTKAPALWGSRSAARQQAQQALAKAAAPACTSSLSAGAAAAARVVRRRCSIGRLLWLSWGSAAQTSLLLGAHPAQDACALKQAHNHLHHNQPAPGSNGPGGAARRGSKGWRRRGECRGQRPALPQ